MKILIADDDRVLQQVLLQATASFGHEAMLSCDGEVALTVLDTFNDIDLIITDVQMPEMDGREFIARVRKHQKYADIPIIVISGEVDQSAVDDLIDPHNMCFISKPLDVSKLEESLQKLKPEV